jgi:hypothetical protein
MGDAVLTLDADTGRHRARVFRLSEAVFRVEAERLVQDYDAGGEWRGAFWSAIPDIVSYTDNLERAAELAAESLRAGQAVEP